MVCLICIVWQKISFFFFCIGWESLILPRRLDCWDFKCKILHIHLNSSSSQPVEIWPNLSRSLREKETVATSRIQSWRKQDATNSKGINWPIYRQTKHLSYHLTIFSCNSTLKIQRTCSCFILVWWQEAHEINRNNHMRAPLTSLNLPPFFDPVLVLFLAWCHHVCRHLINGHLAFNLDIRAVLNVILVCCLPGLSSLMF